MWDLLGSIIPVYIKKFFSMANILDTLPYFILPSIVLFCVICIIGSRCFKLQFCYIVLSVKKRE
ncbi:MAG: hypothetical protein BWY11_01120 [Firmicutes bacterium ADurb.Bin182]|nr:MAG: hypothetical protein BWY11_01120 [Firmicutes bacterium ADurb.Bin182]